MSLFYAVKIGRIPGIYLSWLETEAQVKGVPDALYKKFKTHAEAAEFLLMENDRQILSYQLWTDGAAILGNSASYGYVGIINSDEIIFEGSNRIPTPPYTAPHAEVQAMLAGLKTMYAYALKNIFLPLYIFSDNEFVVKTLTIWELTVTDKLI